MFQTIILANWIIVNGVDAAQPAEHSALTLRLIDPIVFEIWQNVENLILANWRNNSVVDAAQPAEHNALTQQFLRYDKMFKTLFFQIDETTV
jgi:hypothetical protein